jgi:EAL domain-containing protein (putative c-di-GMP-specific phosphodiesterase class I)
LDESSAPALDHGGWELDLVKDRGFVRPELADRLELQEQLRDALQRRELVLRYQPVVSLEDRATLGYEALIRWQHPQRGLLQPAEFIPLAEDEGLICDVGAWVLKQACRQAYRWRSQGWQGYVSVNVSPVQLLTDGFAGMAEEVLQETGLPPSRLYLEVTETPLIADPGRLAPAVHTLKGLGVGIAIDDFGSAAYSPAVFGALPFDMIKIDGLFVQRLPDRPDDRDVLADLISLADALEMSVIAEGVESERQDRELRRLGCHLAQGFLYSRPQRAEQLELSGVEAGSTWPTDDRDGLEWSDAIPQVALSASR